MKQKYLVAGLLVGLVSVVLVAIQAPRWARAANEPAAATGADPWRPLVYRLSPPGVAVAMNLYSDGRGAETSNE